MPGGILGAYYMRFDQAAKHFKMVQTIEVEGYDAFKEAVKKNSGKLIFVLFSGSLDSSGKSWCEDCVKAHPVIEEGIKSAPADSILILCRVGNREFWKDQTNAFRTDPQLKLTGVPTLMKYGTPQRLGDSDCSKLDLVKMIFSDED